MRRRSVTIRVQWHEVERGLWCSRCLLPSMVRWALLNVESLHVLARVEQCADCGMGDQLR